MHRLTILVALAGAALSLNRAAAQTARWDGIPDFDQRRTNLSNNGSSHCVPTASINLMAFIANHGAPAMMNGPRSWQSQAQHNFVSGNIFVMGGLMGTDGTNGTDGLGWETGLRTWLDSHAPGVFTLTNLYVTPGTHSVTPQTIYNAIHGGSLVAIAYGRYRRPLKFEPPYERTGGHAVTPTVITLSTTPGLGHTVQYRDPATDDGNLDTQSTFSTRIAVFERETIQLTDGTSRTMWQMHIDPPPPLSTIRCMDEIVIVDPTFILAPTIQAVAVHRPWRILGSLAPQAMSIPAPAGLSIQRVELAPDQVSAMVVTNAGPGFVPRLWHLTLEGGMYDELATLPTADAPLVVSRHTGEIYLTNADATLIHYTTMQGPNGDLVLAPHESHHPASPSAPPPTTTTPTK